MTEPRDLMDIFYENLISRLSDKIKDLDDKFENTISLCLSQKRSYQSEGYNYQFSITYHQWYDTGFSSNAKLDGFAKIHFAKALNPDDYLTSFSSIIFEVGTIEDCINKAHDYFIVHGGEL